MISITVSLNWRDTYEGQSHRAGSSHRHKSASVSNRLRRALVPHTDIHSRNSGSRSPRDAEAKAGKSNRTQKHTTLTPDANGGVIIVSEYMYTIIRKERVIGSACDWIESKSANDRAYTLNLGTYLYLKTTR